MREINFAGKVSHSSFRFRRGNSNVNLLLSTTFQFEGHTWQVWQTVGALWSLWQLMQTPMDVTLVA